MAARKVQVFFYGSYINLSALEEAGIKRRAFAPAAIHGFVIEVKPLANLVEGGDGVVYGILANLTHDELDQIYRHATDTLKGHVYNPEAVIVHTRGGKTVPAMVYICHEMEAGKADPAYVERILESARSYGFPKWYQERLASFKAA
ncbi:gamma-glutamylcyclotransferase [Kordiimonas marina]|uniref:gamma-glutamylcyclotransferase n=1 Tax=Kordiimonas marina TaxID=2872312 RepID=UPI001FF5E6CA|nr:gamma-glutamylcyclotransferase [Kordiimonas marina]MCJ9428603.1 gamma-glutamylcyclotransferase [Kordiimonas marina]